MTNAVRRSQQSSNFLPASTCTSSSSMTSGSRVRARAPCEIVLLTAHVGSAPRPPTRKSERRARAPHPACLRPLTPQRARAHPPPPTPPPPYPTPFSHRLPLLTLRPEQRHATRQLRQRKQYDLRVMASLRLDRAPKDPARAPLPMAPTLLPMAHARRTCWPPECTTTPSYSRERSY